MRTLRLQVTMDEVEPEVHRVLDVPAGVLLPELHDLLQAALGWTDSHLHLFDAGDVQYGVPDGEGLDEDRDENGVPLRSLPDRFSYHYDFGDGWTHEVEVTGPGGDRPGVVAGHGACPPEDVGGPHGYAEFLEAWAGPRHREHERLRTWAGSWTDRFDLQAADLLVQQTAGAVPATVRFVLGALADGVKLTPGGRLPRAVVRQVQERYPAWEPLGRPASVEDDLAALAALHELMRDVGLLRLRKGVLAPTRAAGDDVEVIRRLRSWFGPVHGFESILAGDAVALVAAAGPSSPRDMAGRLLDLLGGRWVTGVGQRLGESDVVFSLYDLEPELVGLDLVTVVGEAWTAGPSALWLLPRATALAHLWSDHFDAPPGGR